MEAHNPEISEPSGLSDVALLEKVAREAVFVSLKPEYLEAGEFEDLNRWLSESRDARVALGSFSPLILRLLSDRKALVEALESVTNAYTLAHYALGVDPERSESLKAARSALSLIQGGERG
jgi:hypothetical protein